MSRNYTNSQLKFLMNLKKRGLTYREISKKFSEKFGIKKSPAALSDTFQRYRDDYDLDGLKSHVEVKSEVMKTRILDAFLNIISIRKFVPTLAEFCRTTDYSENQIKNYFESFSNLEKTARINYPDVFDSIIDPHSFTEESIKKLRDEINNTKRFFITTAVTGCKAHSKALSSIKTFCDKRKAKLLVLVCSDPAHTKQSKYDFVLSNEIPSESVVFKDINLNSNLFLSTIKTSAKQINPLTGLSRLAQKKGSFIFASPKQDIEHLTDKNKKSIPKAMMTTGAITIPDYNTDLYMSERTATIAEEDHILGGIIVEIKNNKVFFYRPVQFDPRTGAFTDLDTQYFPEGVTKKVTADLVQFGDYHVLSTDPKAKAGGKELVDLTNPDYLTLEDFFDGITINPHTKCNVLQNAVKLRDSKFTLSDELKACSKELNEISTYNFKKQIIMKYGNHEDFLTRWLNNAEYALDKVNHYEGVCLAKASMESNMPFEYAMRVRYPIDNQDRIKFLNVNDSFMVNDIENGAHGHLGANGKRNPTMVGVRNAYGACNVGHNHSGAVYKDVFRAGTKTKLQLDYNNGPSAWTHSDVLQHKDGSRQLITYIDGEFYLKD